MRTVAIAIFAAGAHGFGSTSTADTAMFDLSSRSTLVGGGRGGGGSSNMCPALPYGANPYYYAGDYCMSDSLPHRIVYCSYPGAYPTTQKYCKNGCVKNTQNLPDVCNPEGGSGGLGPSIESCGRYTDCNDCMQYGKDEGCKWEPDGASKCRPASQCDFDFVPLPIMVSATVGVSMTSASPSIPFCYKQLSQCSDGHGGASATKNPEADRCSKLSGCYYCSNALSTNGTPLNWKCGYNKNTGNCFTATTGDCSTSDVVCKDESCPYGW